MNLMVKLSQLRPGAEEINVRRSGRKDGLKELIASIEAVGLIQPLAVRPIAGEEGKFEVTDGNRRLAALLKLAGRKGDVDVPIRVLDRSDADAHEISLAANIVRQNLHPVDEYEAYAAMVGAGRTPEQIAQRFGVKVAWIKQRLQLANLAPELRQAWLKGQLNADQAAALSSCPDHNRQVSVWKKAVGIAGNNYAQRPEILRREVRTHGLEQDDAKVKFVGIEAYAAAGGRFSDDLFTESRLLLDPEIVDSLAGAKLEAACAAYREQGWSWAMTMEQLPCPRWNVTVLSWEDYATEEERAKLDKKKGASTILKEIFERMDQDPNARAGSGVLVGLNDSGEIDADTLRVLPANATVQADEGEGEYEGDEEGAGAEHVEPTRVRAPRAADEPEKPRITYALRESLSAALTEALAGAMRSTSGHQAALSAVIAGLTTEIQTWRASALRIKAPVALPSERLDETTWAAAFEAAEKRSLDDNLAELARLVSLTIDFKQPQFDDRIHRGWDIDRAPAIEALAKAFPPDILKHEMNRVFDPEDYFSRVSAALCHEAIAEMGRKAPSSAKKKAELANLAAAYAKECGWLPIELRTACYDPPKAADKAA